VVALRDVEGGRQEYRVRLPFASPSVPAAIEIRLLDDDFTLAIQAATLYDERTGMFSALLPSDRGHFARVHSGDVKIYANQDLLPRAYVVTETVAAQTPQEAVQLLQGQLAARPTLLPTTVVEGLPALRSDGSDGVVSAEIVSYAPERVEVRAEAAAPSLLVLADAFYPGWRATVDGEETPIVPANVLFRGVALPRGEHTVVFTFEPKGWRLGVGLAALGLLLLAACSLLALWGFRRRQRDEV
jgi:hypothetical protein